MTLRLRLRVSPAPNCSTRPPTSRGGDGLTKTSVSMSSSVTSGPWQASSPGCSVAIGVVMITPVVWTTRRSSPAATIRAITRTTTVPAAKAIQALRIVMSPHEAEGEQLEAEQAGDDHSRGHVAQPRRDPAQRQRERQAGEGGDREQVAPLDRRRFEFELGDVQPGEQH